MADEPATPQRIVDLPRAERRKRMVDLLLSAAAAARNKSNVSAMIAALSRASELADVEDEPEPQADWSPSIIICPVPRGQFLPEGGIPPIEGRADPEKIAAQVSARLIAAPPSPYTRLEAAREEQAAAVNPALLPAPAREEPESFSRD